MLNLDRIFVVDSIRESRKTFRGIEDNIIGELHNNLKNITSGNSRDVLLCNSIRITLGTIKTLRGMEEWTALVIEEANLYYAR